MNTVLKDSGIFMQSAGKLVQITGIFSTDAAANDYCETNASQGVIAEAYLQYAGDGMEYFNLTAAVEDLGVKRVPGAVPRTINASIGQHAAPVFLFCRSMRKLHHITHVGKRPDDKEIMQLSEAFGFKWYGNVYGANYQRKATGAIRKPSALASGFKQEVATFLAAQFAAHHTATDAHIEACVDTHITTLRAAIIDCKPLGKNVPIKNVPHRLAWHIAKPSPRYELRANVADLDEWIERTYLPFCQLNYTHLSTVDEGFFSFVKMQVGKCCLTFRVDRIEHHYKELMGRSKGNIRAIAA